MIVYGAGGHAKVVIETLEASQQAVEKVYDDDIRKTSVLNHKVFHGYDNQVMPQSPLVIAIGNNKIRKMIAENLSHQAGMVLHPNAKVSPYATVGSGTVVFNAAIVQPHAAIGRHAIINTSAIVEHDCKIGDYCHVAPRATLCGEVSVGEGTLIGAGAVILPGVKIGNWAVIGAGCVIKKDVPDQTVVKFSEPMQQISAKTPFQEKHIYLSPPHLGENERKYVEEVFASNWIAPQGDAIEQFEKSICQSAGAAGAVALNSGTAALHLALILLGIEEGDEVICPTFTFAATAHPILYQKARPVFIDCDLSCWNIDIKHLEEAIKSRIKKGKKPKAIIGVHNYGMPVDMDALLSLAQKYEIPLIEDAAEAVGSTYRGQYTGTFGAIGVYSFNGNKIVTTGGGGALLSANPGLIEKAKFLATQARDPFPYYQHSVVGYNYRMSNVLAAIGNGQLEKLSERVNQRRAVFDYYKSQLSEIPNIRFQKEIGNGRSNRWLSCIVFEEKEAPAKVKKIKKALEEASIEARYLWKPLHTQPVFKGCLYFGSSVAEKLFNQGLCLPSGSSLTTEQLNRIISIIRSHC